MYERVSHNLRSEHLVVVVPSLSMDPRELAKISGAHHYEERLLFFLMLLRRPRTRVLFLTSQAIHSSVVDYYLHLLSGVPTSHARKRLILMDCADASSVPLGQAALATADDAPNPKRHPAPRVGSHGVLQLERARANARGTARSRCTPTTPSLLDLGTKSGCRETFREAGILFLDGFERLHSEDEIVEALATLKGREPEMRRRRQAQRGLWRGQRALLL